MEISIVHSIRREIDAQYYYIKTMIETYPSFMKNWVSKEEEKNRGIAKEYANGDDEVFFTTYQNLCYGMDVFDETTNHFYQAVFLVAYSYYESWLNRFGKEVGVKKENVGVKELKKELNFTIDNDIQEMVDYLYQIVRPFRNLIAHNNGGTSKAEQKNALMEVRSKYKDIEEYDLCVRINGNDFILDVLEMEHKVLLEFCDKLGYGRFVK